MKVHNAHQWIKPNVLTKKKQNENNTFLLHGSICDTEFRFDATYGKIYRGACPRAILSFFFFFFNLFTTQHYLQNATPPQLRDYLRRVFFFIIIIKLSKFVTNISKFIMDIYKFRTIASKSLCKATLEQRFSFLFSSSYSPNPN